MTAPVTKIGNHQKIVSENFSFFLFIRLLVATRSCKGNLVEIALNLKDFRPPPPPFPP